MQPPILQSQIISPYKISATGAGRAEDQTSGDPPAEPVRRNSATETKVVEFEDPGPSIPEGLDASLARLRELQRSAAATLRKLLREGRIAEAASMRTQHASILRSLFDAECQFQKYLRM